MSTPVSEMTPRNSPSASPSPFSSPSRTPPTIERSYEYLLKAAERCLEIGGEDSMNMLNERIRKFMAAYRLDSEAAGTLTPRKYAEVDESLLELLNKSAELKTSPEAEKLRDALVPLVKARKNILVNSAVRRKLFAELDQGQ